MKIRSLYHTPESSFGLCKELKFTHANLTLWTYPDSFAAVRAIGKAHDLGLHCIISDRIKDEEKEHYEESMRRVVRFLPLVDCKEGCLVSVYDEPNSRRIPLKEVLNFASAANRLMIKTICVLGWTEPYCGYENCADYIGFNYYKDLTLLRKFNLWARIKTFQIRNRSPLVAVPAVKPGKIISQAKFWKEWIGIENFYWYQFHPQQETPPWTTLSVDELPDVMNDLRRLNAELV